MPVVFRHNGRRAPLGVPLAWFARLLHATGRSPTSPAKRMGRPPPDSPKIKLTERHDADIVEVLGARLSD